MNCTITSQDAVGWCAVPLTGKMKMAPRHFTQPWLEQFFSLAVTASSSYCETVSTGREVAAACQHCILCRRYYYYYFFKCELRWPKHSGTILHHLATTRCCFFTSRLGCWHLAAIQRRAVNLDLTSLIILPAAGFTCASLVMLVGETRNRDFLWVSDISPKHNSPGREPKPNSSTLTFHVQIWRFKSFCVFWRPMKNGRRL